MTRKYDQPIVIPNVLCKPSIVIIFITRDYMRETGESKGVLGVAKFADMQLAPCASPFG